MAVSSGEPGMKVRPIMLPLSAFEPARRHWCQRILLSLHPTVRLRAASCLIFGLESSQERGDAAIGRTRPTYSVKAVRVEPPAAETLAPLAAVAAMFVPASLPSAMTTPAASHAIGRVRLEVLGPIAQGSCRSSWPNVQDRQIASRLYACHL